MAVACLHVPARCDLTSNLKVKALGLRPIDCTISRRAGRCELARIEFGKIVALDHEHSSAGVKPALEELAFPACFVVLADYRFEDFAILVHRRLRFEDVGVAEVHGLFRRKVIDHTCVRRYLAGFTHLADCIGVGDQGRQV
ncbi:hypothetical protein D3C76_1474970 [compost metagenome]